MKTTPLIDGVITHSNPDYLASFQQPTRPMQVKGKEHVDLAVTRPRAIIQLRNKCSNLIVDRCLFVGALDQGGHVCSIPVG